MEENALIEPSEVTAMLFAVADLNLNVWLIRTILEAEYGEEEDPEDDS